MPLITIYEASDARRALIIRSSGKGKVWRFIEWDMEKNLFNPGQWICGKDLCGKSCALSADGRTIFWKMVIYSKDSDTKTHWGISSTPNFRAVLFSEKTGSCLQKCHFEVVTGRPINTMDLGLASGVEECFVELAEGYSVDDKGCAEDSGSTIAESGLKPSDKPWIDKCGNKIHTVGYKLFVNDIEVYDCTDHIFEPIGPVPSIYVD